MKSHAVVALAFCAGMLLSHPAGAEQTQMVFDAACIAEKVSACVEEASSNLTPLGFQASGVVGTSGPVTRLCFGEGGVHSSGIEDSVREAVARSFWDSRNAYGQNPRTFCVRPNEVENTPFRECSKRCNIKALDLDINQLCYYSVISRSQESENNCIEHVERPDVKFLEEGFIEALNKIAEEVRGFGERTLEPEPTSVLACPDGQSSFHYAEPSQQAGLEAATAWLDSQFDPENDARVPSIEFEQELKLVGAEADSFITIQYFSTSARANAFHWHRFIQTALAREVRVFRAGDDFANHEPFDGDRIEIVIPEHVDVPSRPYLLSCSAGSSEP